MKKQRMVGNSLGFFLVLGSVFPYAYVVLYFQNVHTEWKTAISQRIVGKAEVNTSEAYVRANSAEMLPSSVFLGSLHNVWFGENKAKLSLDHIYKVYEQEQTCTQHSALETAAGSNKWDCCWHLTGSLGDNMKGRVPNTVVLLLMGRTHTGYI